MQLVCMTSLVLCCAARHVLTHLNVQVWEQAEGGGWLKFVNDDIPANTPSSKQVLLHAAFGDAQVRYPTALCEVGAFALYLLLWFNGAGSRHR